MLCSSGPVPCSVAADDVNADHAENIRKTKTETRKQQLLEPITATILPRPGPKGQRETAVVVVVVAVVVVDATMMLLLEMIIIMDA